MRRFQRLTLGLLVIAAAACGGSDGSATASDLEATAESEPGCREIERFAAALTDTGITYDYTPSASPAELAEDTDVAFVGILTGEVAAYSEDTGDQPRDTEHYVGYQVRVTRAAEGTTQIAGGDVVEVFVPYNPANQDARYYDAATVAGIEVAIFASDHEPLGELVAEIEGFATACPGGELLGWTGHLAGWDGLTSAREVLDAVES